MKNINKWTLYKPKYKVGKLCYYLCSYNSILPVRDILDDQGQGRKPEPNLESATYNEYSECNQDSVRCAVSDGLSHILFVTRYKGNNEKYYNRYFITGYYEIGWNKKFSSDTVAIRAKQMCFVQIENAYEITPQRWRKINTNGKTKVLKNLRWATQRIESSLLDDIIEHLSRHCKIDYHFRETAHLKAQYNPFDSLPNSLPSGKIYIINVGANTSDPLQSPLYHNNEFEFVPIQKTKRDSKNYNDLFQFKHPTKPLLDIFSPKIKIGGGGRI